MDQESYREAPAGGNRMSQIITATFEDGIFKPDAPPALDPKARVRLIVEPLEAPREATEAEECRQEIERQWTDPARLADAQSLDDLLDEISFVSGEPRPSRDELHDRH
jgi:predicted DNA-binding antitoxin AbrB/MazE fold protein